MQSILVFAFAAAALGGFDSPLGAVVGGLIVGVADALTDEYVDALDGIELVVPFGLILLVLLFRPAGPVRQDAGGARVMTPAPARASARGRWPSRSSSCCSSGADVPQTHVRRDRHAAVAQALYIGIAAMGLNLLTGYNGQVSIGHGAFFGVGAYTTAILMHDHGWDVPARRLPRCAAASLCFVVGALVGFPALRVQGPLPRARHARARGALPRPRPRRS